MASPNPALWTTPRTPTRRNCSSAGPASTPSNAAATSTPKPGAMILRTAGRLASTGASRLAGRPATLNQARSAAASPAVMPFDTRKTVSHDVTAKYSIAWRPKNAVTAQAVACCRSARAARGRACGSAVELPGSTARAGRTEDPGATGPVRLPPCRRISIAPSTAGIAHMARAPADFRPLRAAAAGSALLRVPLRDRSPCCTAPSTSRCPDWP